MTICVYGFVWTCYRFSTLNAQVQPLGCMVTECYLSGVYTPVTDHGENIFCLSEWLQVLGYVSFGVAIFWNSFSMQLRPGIYRNKMSQIMEYICLFSFTYTLKPWHKMTTTTQFLSFRSPVSPRSVVTVHSTFFFLCVSLCSLWALKFPHQGLNLGPQQ